MPRFSANLGHLFTEYPLIERIGAAAKVGFKAIELQLPYELAPSTVKAELDRYSLTMLNINSPQGPGGEPGLAAIARREKEFAALFEKARVEQDSEKRKALVFDIQDVGCRFYTYISTMGLAMEAAGKAGVKYFVLDRVNPINGDQVVHRTFETSERTQEH